MSKNVSPGIKGAFIGVILAVCAMIVGDYADQLRVKRADYETWQTTVSMSFDEHIIPTTFITNATYKATKAGTGHLIEFVFEVIDGDHKGFPLRSWINVDNPNPKATEIGLAEFSALCRAVNVLTPKDTVEFINKPLNLKVAVKPRNDGEGMTNEVKAYEATGNYQAAAGGGEDLPF